MAHATITNFPTNLDPIGLAPVPVLMMLNVAEMFKIFQNPGCIIRKRYIYHINLNIIRISSTTLDNKKLTL